jgi:hypothetical protein
VNVVFQCRKHFPQKNTPIWCSFWECVTVMLLPLPLSIAGGTLTTGFRILKQFKGHSTHYGKQAWPPRSPDLSPLDYCIWGWMKDIVYQRKAQTREELLARIMHAATEIRDNSVNLRRSTCGQAYRSGGRHFLKCVIMNYRQSSPQKLICFCDNKCIKMM